MRQEVMEYEEITPKGIVKRSALIGYYSQDEPHTNPLFVESNCQVTLKSKKSGKERIQAYFKMIDDITAKLDKKSDKKIFLQTGSTGLGSRVFLIRRKTGFLRSEPIANIYPGYPFLSKKSQPDVEVTLEACVFNKEADIAVTEAFSEFASKYKIDRVYMFDPEPIAVIERHY